MNLDFVWEFCIIFIISLFISETFFFHVVRAHKLKPKPNHKPCKHINVVSPIRFF